MTECVLSALHQFDPEASVFVNLVGDSASGLCQTAFVAGLSFACYVLLIGNLAGALLWRRWPRWTAAIVAVSIAYWSLIKLSHLSFFEMNAVISQATFEILMLGLLPTGLALSVIRLRQKHLEAVSSGRAAAA